LCAISVHGRLPSGDGPTFKVGCPGERLVNVALPDGVPSKLASHATLPYNRQPSLYASLQKHRRRFPSPSSSDPIRSRLLPIYRLRIRARPSRSSAVETGPRARLRGRPERTIAVSLSLFHIVLVPGADFRRGFNLRNTQHEQMSSRSSPKSARWSGTPQSMTWIDRLWNVSRACLCCLNSQPL
jgi:hypothetical protein